MLYMPPLVWGLGFSQPYNHLQLWSGPQRCGPQPVCCSAKGKKVSVSEIKELVQTSTDKHSCSTFTKQFVPSPVISHGHFGHHGADWRCRYCLYSSWGCLLWAFPLCWMLQDKVVRVHVLQRVGKRSISFDYTIATSLKPAGPFKC